VFNENISNLLVTENIVMTPEQLAQLTAFCNRVRSSNEATSLVSAGDAARLESVHVPDSLSLGGWLCKTAGVDARVLDIGSGGGFPAIPLKIALPAIRLTMVERSVKKSEFLRGTIQELGLTDVEVVTGEFPAAAKGMTPDVITARAVERPEKTRKQILDFMMKSCFFFCQMPERLGSFPTMFHVERIVDRWKEEGIRRGTLDIVRQK